MNIKKSSWTFGIFFAVAAVFIGWWYIHAINLKSQEQAIRKQIFIADANEKAAPDFKLIDQRGKSITLSSLKGKVVVLQPMDPKCTDVCPIVSQELIDANQQLGVQAKDVVYLGLNVNENHESQADLLDFSKQHGLNHLSNWHFLTGSTSALKAVWKAYGIGVIPNKDGDVEHSTNIYFIDKNGMERYVGFPDSEKTNISSWSRGIAFFAKELM